MDVELCGRPTRSGGSCRNVLARFELACRVHETEADAQMRVRLHEAWRDGYRLGHESGRDAERLEVERAAAQAVRAERFHTHRGGRQVVNVNGYSYLAPEDVELAVGDRVKLPPNWLVPSATWETITALGTEYDGALSDVLDFERVVVGA